MTIRLPIASRNAAADAIVDRADAGPAAATMQLRSGSQPLSAENAATGTLLATVTLADPAFGAASGGTAPLVDPAPVAYIADGTVGWFRVLDSTGATVLDGSAGPVGSGADLELASVVAATGAQVDLAGGGGITVPAG